MNRQVAFIDEFGNNGLDFSKTDVSTHFIVTAVLFDEQTLPSEESKIEDVRRTFFQTGEMKSSKIASDDSRRLKLLNALNHINYHIFSVVVDKRELTTEGFKYKPSFYKFLHSLVDSELFRVFPRLQIVADEHGGDAFKNGFIKYIEDNHVSDLFNQEFSVSNSKSDLAVQLADIITGTIARCYETTKLSAQKQDFLELLRSKITDIRFWPPEQKIISFTKKEHSAYDKSIAELSISLAEQQIAKYSSSNIPAEIHQATCLRYLVFYFRNINADKYIPTFELINNIEAIKGGKITMHYFRSKIIAKLRDRGILISSSSKGYKLPSCISDLTDFVSHSNSYIQPMIDRIFVCRNMVKLATKNSVDILDNPDLKYLNELKNNWP